MFVVEAAVASDLATNEVGLSERFVGTTQLHLRHHKTIVVAVELVYLLMLLVLSSSFTEMKTDVFSPLRGQISRSFTKLQPTCSLMCVSVC